MVILASAIPTVNAVLLLPKYVQFVLKYRLNVSNESNFDFTGS